MTIQTHLEKIFVVLHYSHSHCNTKLTSQIQPSKPRRQLARGLTQQFFPLTETNGSTHLWPRDCHINLLVQLFRNHFNEKIVLNGRIDCLIAFFRNCLINVTRGLGFFFCLFVNPEKPVWFGQRHDSSILTFLMI